MNEYMKRLQNTPIGPLKEIVWDEIYNREVEECQEKMVPASLVPEKILVRPQYFLQGIEGAPPECFVRETVLDKLVEVAGNLSGGYKLVLFDTWRPIPVQRELFEQYKKELAEEYSEKNDDELTRLALRYVSLPGEEDRNVSPHNTGGAVDLTIADNTGRWLEMGTEFDETSEQSHTRYYEEKNERGEKLDPREEKALVNRRLLYHLMAEVDFTNFRNEWWHFDYGNKVWACMKGYDQKAFYGRATVKFRWK